MGAHSDVHTVSRKATPIDPSARQYLNSQAEREFADLREELAYQYGHNPYNGTLSNCRLTKIHRPMTEEEVTKYLGSDLVWDRIAKREAECIPILDGGKVVALHFFGMAPS